MKRLTATQRTVNAVLYALCQENEAAVLAFVRDRYSPSDTYPPFSPILKQQFPAGKDANPNATNDA